MTRPVTLSERQEKVIARLFREGIDGFKGGLSAENYISITENVPCHGDRRFAGSYREGRTDQDRRAASHPVSPKLAKA